MINKIYLCESCLEETVWCHLLRVKQLFGIPNIVSGYLDIFVSPRCIIILHQWIFQIPFRAGVEKYFCGVTFLLLPRIFRKNHILEDPPKSSKNGSSRRNSYWNRLSLKVGGPSGKPAVFSNGLILALVSRFMGENQRWCRPWSPSMVSPPLSRRDCAAANSSLWVWLGNLKIVRRGPSANFEKLGSPSLWRLS